MEELKKEFEPINFEEHAGLVIDVIRKTFKGIDNAHSIAQSKGMEFQDLEQVGKIALWKAAQRFDQSKGYKFSTYASNCIRGEILTELNSNSLIKVSTTKFSKEERDKLTSNILSTHKQVGEKGDTIESLLPDNSSYYDSIISDINAEQLIEDTFLKEQELIVAKERILFNKSFADIGKEHGRSRQATEMTYKRAVKKLRLRLDKEDFGII